MLCQSYTLTLNVIYFGIVVPPDNIRNISVVRLIVNFNKINWCVLSVVVINFDNMYLPIC